MGKKREMTPYQKNQAINYGFLIGLLFVWSIIVWYFWKKASIVYFASLGLGIIWFLVIRSIFYKEGVGIQSFIGNSKDKKSKEKAKKDSLKKVLEIEKEYVKNMGESGIASYDEQQKRDIANKKKVTRFGFIMLCVSIIWLLIGSFITSYKFMNYNVVEYLKKYTMYNDVNTLTIPMEFNEKELNSLIDVSKSKESYEKAINYHIENDIYYVTKPLLNFNKNITPEQIDKETKVAVKGLQKAIEIQQKLNDNYVVYLDKEIPKKQDLIWKYESNTDPKIQKAVENEKQNIEFLNKQRSILDKTVYNMGDQLKEYEKAKLQSETAYIQREEVIMNTIISAVNSYNNVQKSIEDKELADLNYNVAKKKFKQKELEVEVGSATDTDLLKAMSELEKAESIKLKTEYKYSVSIETLKMLIEK